MFELLRKVSRRGVSVFYALVAFVRLRVGRAGAFALLGTFLLVAAIVYLWPVIAPFLGVERAQAATYNFQTGYFVGDGASKVISGLGFTPEVVILKADTAGGTGAIMKTTVMPLNSVAYLGTATADDVAAAIRLTEDGFIVTGALSNTLANRYTWVAFAGSDCTSGGQLCVGTYTGDGAATKAVATGFDPDLVLVKRTTNVVANWRSNTMSDNYAQFFSATAQDTTGTYFTTLDGTGFTVGATNNATGGVYHYVAWKEVAGVIDVGTYVGTGIDNRTIGGVGFQPDWMFTKYATGTVGAVQNLSESYGDSSSYFTDTANLVSAIQELKTDGFEVGTSNTANANGLTYHYAAFGGTLDHEASGTFASASGMYIGNGEGKVLSNLPFTPDLVIVRASSTEHAVFRTSMMGGDSTAYFGLASANITSAITALSANGFTVGTSTTVNGVGIEYQWVAYGNAWKPETHTGASDFVIGAYYGNATDTRAIARLPMSPDLLVVKQSGAALGVWRSSEHAGDATSYFSATADTVNRLQALRADGFEIGNDNQVNQAGQLYWYFGFATGTNMSVGTYSGTGAAQNIGTAFTPDHAWVKQTGAVEGVLRTASTTASTSFPFVNSAPVNDAIEGFGPNSFAVGTGAEVNSVGANNYRYAIWADTASVGTSTYAMQTGYFMGDGGTKDITGLGFAPDLVIIKADTTAGTGAAWKSVAMPQHTSAYLGSATANNAAGQIVLTANGFRVAGANTNTAATRYTYVAFTGSDCSATGRLCVGSYAGTGAATKAIATGFQPDLVWSKHATSTTILPTWRSSLMGNNVAQFFSATAQNATGAYFSTLDAGGFTVGATNNAAAATYYFAAFKEVAGVIDVGTYVGNATIDRSIGGVGFKPSWMFTKSSTGAVGAVQNMTESYGDHTSYFADTANIVDAIQALESDGFQVGGSATAHANGVTYFYAAFGGAGAHTANGTYQMLSGSYVGTGASHTIAGLSFPPDLVIIKGDTAQAGVFTTRMMGGDSTAYLDSPNANFAGGITSLSPDRFTVGTNASVNSAGVTYYWTAFGNAWNPDSHSGAADFAIGAFYGNGIDARDITRLPFSPDMVTVKRNGVTGGTWRTSEHAGDSSSFFAGGVADGANRVQALNNDGFEVGTNAEANLVNNIYWYFAFATSSTFAVDTYSGTGAGQDISVGFQPYHLWVKHTGTSQAVLRPYALSGDSALPFVNASGITGAITGLTSDGFSLGTAAETNTAGANNYRFAAWKQVSLYQTHYHFRADDGSESSASSRTAGSEDSPLAEVREGLSYRLRIGVANKGAASASTTGFRLEYAEKGASCALSLNWTRVGDAAGAWDMYDSPNLTDGANTTNISIATGGVTDENPDFLSSNGGVKDTGDETSPITVGVDEFTEFEYAITPTAYATDTTAYCFRLSAQGTVLSEYGAYPEATFALHLTATSTGTQVSELAVPTTNQYVGGAFVLVDDTPGDSHAITDVMLTEAGTVDAAASLDNIRLYYEYDAAAPYDCASETYAGTETQFGVTDTDGFSGPDGTAAFAGSVEASSTQAVCLYTVLDVTSSALSGETIDLTLADASAIGVSGGDVVRLSSVPLAIAGATTLTAPLLTQTHYHFRLDNGSEAGASSATGGSEDTPLINLNKGTPRRLRFGVSNEGSATSSATAFRVEYAPRAGSCAATENGWTDVGGAGGAWDLYDSTHLTDGDHTTNIAVANGGVTDENTVFLGVNGAVKDTSSQTGGIILEPINHTDLEYAVVALVGAQDGESYCFRVTDTGTALPGYAAYPEVTIAADVLVSATGTHIEAVRASSSDKVIAGTWVVTDQGGSRNVTKITLTETGTIDATSNLSNVRLYYDLDTSSPYNCASESYTVGDAQYGATSSAFSSPNSTSTFSGSVGISTTASMCLYAVMDVEPDAGDGETIALTLANPSIDVGVSAGTVNPNDPVAPTGSTTVHKSLLYQQHFHFRNDDGSETTATSKTGGVEDVALSEAKVGAAERLRIQVSNEGGTTSLSTVFRIEYAEKASTCAAAASWTTVGSSGAVWSMSESDNLTDEEDTTNIAAGLGGMTDENPVFVSPNSGVHENRAISNPLTLDMDEFVELEYVLEPNTDASAGSTYCFRLVGNDDVFASYDAYPEATLGSARDFLIQRGTLDIANGTSTNSLVAGSHYTAPKASTSAFIRITNAMHTGAGATAAGGNQNANTVTVSILNPSDIETGVTFARSGNLNSTRIYWELVEYVGPPGGDNEIKVRAQDRATYGAADTTVTTGAVSGIEDDSTVVVFITGQQNPAANLTNYAAGLSTSAWNAGTDDATFTRGIASSQATIVSYAVVEFTGRNWRIQRREHAHGAAGATESELITPVNDLSRAFLHTQKRTSDPQVDEFGHQVWLSGVGQVDFAVPATVANAGTHTSVAWVIENTQTNGKPMMVSRTNGSQAAGGAEPSTYPIAIGATLSAVNNASIFMNMWGLGDTTNHPRAIMGAGITSDTHYELWISDTGSGRAYRTEVVDWPTADLSFEQYYYAWYDNNDVLDPTDPWPPGVGGIGENAAIRAVDAPPTAGDVLRLRMAVRVNGSSISQQTKAWKLQYGERVTTCDAIPTWHDTGDSASTTVLWRGYNATPADGTPLSTNPPTPGDLNLSVSISGRAGTYEEANPSALNPYKVIVGESAEYDWILEAYNVPEQTSYCFRMVESDATPFLTYTYYPTLTTAGFKVESRDWRWYGDEDAVTPISPLAATNSAPASIAQGQVSKLRVLVEELAGKMGQGVKFKLQFSEHPDFSGAHDVASADDCTSGSRFCYADGAGLDAAPIEETVLYGADECVAGVGQGCGTHNELPYAPDVVGEVGTTSINHLGTTVMLQHTYDDPIFIVEAITGDSAGGDANRPAAAVITATTTSSFTVRIQEPDDEPNNHGVETVSYLVMERGAYVLPDGRRVDVNSTTTMAYRSNVLPGTSNDTCTFDQSFDSVPVVLTALQSNANTGVPDFLTTTQENITNSSFRCAIEVPDSVATAPTSKETIGWVAIESGSFGNNGVDFSATTTTTSITGWSNSPWYRYLWPHAYFTQTPGLVASKQTRAGIEGGWVRYVTLTGSGVELAIDEADGGDRSHEPEKVGLFGFSERGTLYRATTSTSTFAAYAVQEYEFTLAHHDASPGRTYFFRLYDTEANSPVMASTTLMGYPSLVTESGTLTFSVSGVLAGATTEGAVTDVTTSAVSVPFGSLPLGVPRTAAQRLEVTTNAGQGYQVLAYELGGLTAGLGTQIDDVITTNAVPLSWTAACSVDAKSCYGYHTGDDTLAGGSLRFLANDTFAALTGEAQEVAWSSVPVTAESTDIIYRIRAGAGQEAGVYEGRIVYVIVPVF